MQERGVTMKKFRMIIVIIFMVLVKLASAQYRTSPTTSMQNHLPSFSQMGLTLKNIGILDPSKITMSHLVSSSFSSSNLGNSLSALYLNSMIYNVSPKYQWTFDFGMMGTPYNTLQGGWKGGEPIGSIGFIWRPQSNFLISAQVSKGINSSYLWKNYWHHHFSGTDQE